MRSMAMRIQSQRQASRGLRGVPLSSNLAASPRIHPILQLQSVLGNRRVQRLLRHGLAGAGVQIQRAPDDVQEAIKTQKAKRAQECLAQKDEILPPIGLVGGIGRDQTLIDALGSEYDPLKKQILGNPDARKFVCEAGVPAVLALWDMRTATGGLNVAAARAALAADSAKVYSQNIDTSWLRRRRPVRAERELSDVALWVGAEAKATSLPKVLVRPLPAPQRDNVAGAANELDALIQVFENATKAFSAAAITAFDIREKLEEARMESIKAKNPDYAGGPREPLEKAYQIATTLLQQMDSVHAGIEVGELRKNSANVLDAVRKLSQSPSTADTDTIRNLRDVVHSLRKKIADGSIGVKDITGSARRISFVLHYLAALNTPGFAGAPDLKQVGNLDRLDMLEDDIQLVFGSQAMVELEFLIEVGGKIQGQVRTRKSMEAALGHEAPVEPGRADVFSYFKSLAKKSNNDVVKAYENYAGGFFEHRIVVRPEDLTVRGLDEIFSRPLSMAGVRPLVCSGFAVLGADLLAAAGGKILSFIVAIRASADQLRAHQFDDGHAVAVVSRNGETLFVSNDTIVKNEAGAIGPDAVQWTHKNFPLVTTRGKTWQEAQAALAVELAKH